MSIHPFPDPYETGHIDIRGLPDADEILPAVLNAYGLTDTTVTRLETGSYNIHFRVESKRGVFDLRRSNRPIDRSNLAFETEFLDHLRSKGFRLAPRPAATADGEFNLWLRQQGWTLFNWVEEVEWPADTSVTSGRIESAARTLAEIHSAMSDFKPNNQRADWPVFSRPEEWADRWSSRSVTLANHLGEDGRGYRKLSETVTEEISKIDFDRLTQTGCHADYRMKNVRFNVDEVAIVFDFDTAMMSTRLLDVGGAVTRFSPLARGSSTPQADADAGGRFLRIYDEALPLTRYEWEVLPVFIRWRLIRDINVYFDTWWLRVRDACESLFEGTAAEIVNRAR